MKIGLSILDIDFSCLEKCKDLLKEVDFIHLDVMDGVFVPNLTFGDFMIKTLRKIEKKLCIESHLMIINPEKHLDKFLEGDWVSLHIETISFIEDIIEKVKSRGKRLGIAIKPKTPIKYIEKLKGKIDYVLVMSVEPGFSGQKFIEDSVERIEYLKKGGFEVYVDGGINKETAVKVKNAGADGIVSSSYILRSGNPLKRLKELKKILEEG